MLNQSTNQLDGFIRLDGQFYVVEGNSIGRVALKSLESARRLVAIYLSEGIVLKLQNAPTSVRPKIDDFKAHVGTSTHNQLRHPVAAIPPTRTVSARFGTCDIDHWIERTPLALSKRATQWRIRYVNGNHSYFDTLAKARTAVTRTWNRDVLYQFTKTTTLNLTPIVVPPVVTKPVKPLPSSMLNGGAQLYVRFGDTSHRVTLGEQFELDGVKLVVVKL